MSENTPRGIICPKCACKHFDVKHGWMQTGCKYIRKRKCRNCGWAAHTKEIPVSTPETGKTETPKDDFRTGVKPL